MTPEQIAAIRERVAITRAIPLGPGDNFTGADIMALDVEALLAEQEVLLAEREVLLEALHAQGVQKEETPCY